MSHIVKAGIKDCAMLARIGGLSFIESHGSSASTEIIRAYVSEKYTEEAMKEELNDPQNIYHIIYQDKQPAGYSKIIFNSVHPSITEKNVTKLERIYLLKEFYGMNLGTELLNFNIGLSEQHNQAGMWLYVWTENSRAVNFYKKMKFVIIGSYNFQLTDTHSNPNHQMFLKY